MPTQLALGILAEGAGLGAGSSGKGMRALPLMSGRGVLDTEGARPARRSSHATWDCLPGWVGLEEAGVAAAGQGGRPALISTGGARALSRSSASSSPSTSMGGEEVPVAVVAAHGKGEEGRPTLRTSGMEVVGPCADAPGRGSRTSSLEELLVRLRLAVGEAACLRFLPPAAVRPSWRVCAWEGEAE